MDPKGVWTNLDTAKVVYVEWVDAVADLGWQAQTVPCLHPCRTIGYLIGETKDTLLIATTISMQESNARMHIPKAWVTNRRNIETIVSKKQRKSSAAVGKRSTNSEVSN
jgi:hypothetical protein